MKNNKRNYLLFSVSFIIMMKTAHGYQITVAPSILFNSEYTDNMERSNNEREHDFIFLYAANLTTQLECQTGGASLTYSPQYSHYQRYPENNTLRHRANLNLQNGISRNLRLEMHSAYVRTEEPDLELEEDADVRQEMANERGREVYFTNTTGGTVSYHFGEMDSVYAGHDYRIYENENPNVEDNSQHTSNAGMTFWLIPGQLGIETRIAHTLGYTDMPEQDTGEDYDYENQSLFASLIKRFNRNIEGVLQYSRSSMRFRGDGEDYKIYNGEAGLNCAVNSHLSASFRTGYYLRDNEETGYDAGMSYGLNFRQLFPGGAITFQFLSGHDESYFGSETLGFERYYGIESAVRYQFTRNMNGEVFAGFRNDEYLDTEPEREDHTTRAGMRLNFQLGRGITINLAHVYRKIDSTLDANSYKENRFFLGVAWALSRPIRILN